MRVVAVLIGWTRRTSLVGGGRGVGSLEVDLEVDFEDVHNIHSNMMNRLLHTNNVQD
jgi:hypothetical protein